MVKRISVLVFLVFMGLIGSFSSPSAPPSIEVPTPTLRPRRLLPGELVLAASSDDIPAIFASDELFVGVDS